LVFEINSLIERHKFASVSLVIRQGLLWTFDEFTNFFYLMAFFEKILFPIILTLRYC